MREVLTLLMLVSFALPVVGEDEMELQRCIWRCLEDSKGNTDPAYHSCVDKFCTDSFSESKNGKDSSPKMSGSQRDFTVKYNDHGAVINFHKSGHTLYLGNDCDVRSPQLGNGRWGVKGNEIVVVYGSGKFIFPRVTTHPLQHKSAQKAPSEWRPAGCILG